MKFARYLQDTQVPEWKKAYIDYRALKVRLGAIRAQAPQQVTASSTLTTADVDHPHHSSLNEEIYDNAQEPCLEQEDTTLARVPKLYVSGPDPVANDTLEPSYHAPASLINRITSNAEKPFLSLTLGGLPPRIVGTASSAPSQQTPLPPRTPRSPPVFPFLKDPAPATPQPLRVILSKMPPIHARFFDVLDAELDKVETFYAEREKEMYERAKQLREQLSELGIHRQMFHQSSARSKTQRWTKSVPCTLESLIQRFLGSSKPEAPQVGASSIMASESLRGGTHSGDDTSKLGTQATEHNRRSGDQSRSQKMEGIANIEAEKDPDNLSKSNAASSSKALDDYAGSPPKRSNSLPRLMFSGTRNPLDPQEYQHAKRRLRKAVIEHYRGLEVLNNYRILNLTGFRKALKKYEKITSFSVLDAYMKEKVEPSAFASGAIVSTMLKEMEDLYAARFERGDRKKAIDRLRVGPPSKTHHFSTFRSGLWLGLAIPPMISGASQSLRQATRVSLPSWNILLMIYSIFLVPVLLALLIGLNIVVWARERINYVFIFELNSKSRLDHHEYIELPSLLFCTLAHAFWFSFSQIGPPLLWPLVWLAFALVVMLNPMRSLMWGHARWWIIKNVAKLGASGVWKVEFTDFWLGDQFCSLTYSISNLFFVGCFYTHYFVSPPSPTAPLRRDIQPLLHASFLVNVTSLYQPEFSASRSVYQRLLRSAYDPQVQEAWTTCGGAHNWGWYYLLGALPFAVRFVQSLRRYKDSKLPTHLINAGKYGSGIVYYFFYYYWRHQEGPHTGASYIIWIFVAIAYALYGCAWDFLMDWSLCKPHARYPLLRPELVYKTQIPSYYFALISNLCIRFIWVIYTPSNPSYTLRTFIVAILEVLRRVQWNFYRLENEHLGNMDQYRVTREVPLPYSFEVQSNEEEEREEETPQQETRSWFKTRMVWPRRNGGHG